MGDDQSRTARLRAAGCVFAEDEIAMIRRHATSDADIDAAVERRADGLPLEVAVGVAEFAGVTVAVTPGVFVPRTRAEPIVDVAVRTRPRARMVVDLGCGAGALAAALGSRLPEAELHACDLSEAAVDLARRNLPGAHVHHGSWWDALPARLRGQIDLAVGYLPHVPSSRVDGIHADFRAVEPVSAVDGGADGLNHLRAVLAGADEWLAPDGVFITLLSMGQTGGLPGRVEPVDEDDAVLVVGRGTMAP